ncbi:MAG: hypothetical protein HY381_01645 [Candidatus Chisholmbacteria bacterium]|nr:hypothetical protein [Candidatus Chisholmbacteria bacterium]
MDDKTKDDFIKLFNQGFEEIVLPHIERIDQGMEDLKNRLDRVEGRLDTLERKIERSTDRFSRAEHNLKKFRESFVI